MSTSDTQLPPASSQKPTLLRRSVGAIVDASGRRPALVLFLALLFLVGSWTYARKLELRSDFLDLLPRDSPGFKAFEHQLGRVGGESTLLLVVDSPDRKANERFVDDIGGRLEAETKTHHACTSACQDDACRRACGPNFVAYVETGTKGLQRFFESQKWLYAELDDLEAADEHLDHQIAIQTDTVTDLLAPDDGSRLERNAQERKRGEGPPALTAAQMGGGESDTKTTAREPALGMDGFYQRWKKSSTKHDDFPTGYFTNDDGTLMVIRIISSASGTGGYSGDLFLAEMKRRVEEARVTERYHPAMKIGFAGDIPNAVAEKESTLSEAAWASGLALLMILAGIVVFFRSLSSLVVITLPALMGVGAAYAFATATFGYVNTPGAFLGAIIVGNGINYPIVLFARYREFVARGMNRDVARREAVLNAFRAELVGASVASIAYGSLTITRFRGFSQFGLIGFVGMLLVWLAIVPVVPALIVTMEWVQSKLPSALHRASSVRPSDGSSGALVRLLSHVTARWPVPIVIAGGAIAAFCAWHVPGYLRDPWEYNFSKLGSRSSKSTGAGEWSNKADAVFQGKQNIAGTLILADTLDQVLPLKTQILANDKADPKGALIDDIVTIHDFLPGTHELQRRKLDVLDSIRDRLSPGVLAGVHTEAERKRLEEMKPPDDLHPVDAKDLPPLIRRRFEENDGRIGTRMYIKYKFGVSFSDGHTLLRMAATTDNVRLPSGETVQTASRSTIFAEIVRSMERDGPLATFASFAAVVCVVVAATRSRVGTFSVLLALLMGIVSLVGIAALTDTRLNFFNFIVLPITFGIGCEYPFNIFDRARLLKRDVSAAVARSGGAVALCSYTTTVGYGSMLFSDNQALQSFGRLAAWGEVLCVGMALLFLPALLHLLWRKP